MIGSGFANLFKIPEAESGASCSPWGYSSFIGWECRYRSPAWTARRWPLFLLPPRGRCSDWWTCSPGRRPGTVVGLCRWASCPTQLFDHFTAADRGGPHLETAEKEGEQGRKKITQYTRYGTVVLSLIQGMGIAVGLETMTAPGGAAVVLYPDGASG